MKQSKVVWVRIVLGGLLMVASYYQHRTNDLLTKPTEQSNNSRGSELYLCKLLLIGKLFYKGCNCLLPHALEQMLITCNSRHISRSSYGLRAPTVSSKFT